MNTVLTGGCYCGAVKYRIEAAAEEIMMFKCHCRDCQRVSGSGYCPVVFVPAGRLTFTRGMVKRHTTSGDGGPHIRGFCADCGSRLTGGEGPNSTGIGVTASSLDDPTVFRASFENWTADTQPWDPLDRSLPQFSNNPPPQT
jgi:hypothetical protein